MLPVLQTGLLSILDVLKAPMITLGAVSKTKLAANWYSTRNFNNNQMDLQSINQEEQNDRLNTDVQSSLITIGDWSGTPWMPQSQEAAVWHRWCSRAGPLVSTDADLCTGGCPDVTLAA